MKYPYIFGERSPNRSCDEFKDLQYNREMNDLRYSFFEYLKRFYPRVFDFFYRVWYLEIYFMRWPTTQSSFVIAIVNERSHCIVGLYPTFKKAARALRAMSKLRLEDKPF